LLFFAPLWKMEKVAEIGRKVKAIALLFCCFLPLYEKWKWPFMKNGKSRWKWTKSKGYIALLFCCLWWNGYVFYST
jgi:hypothetical protein